MIIIHFMISEQEPMLRVIIVYGGNSSTNRMLVSISISILSSDSIIYSLSIILIIFLFYKCLIISAFDSYSYSTTLA